jgi:serine/threonine protein kinase
MLVTGRAPFQEANDSETLTMILDCKYYLPAYLSADCIDLISKMIVRRPDDRLTLVEIYNHKWVKSGNENEGNTNSGSSHNSSSNNNRPPPESNESSDDNYMHENYNFLSSIKKSFKRNSLAISEDELLNPLIKREHLSEKENKDVIQQMVSGNVAKEEEIIR